VISGLVVLVIVIFQLFLIVDMVWLLLLLTDGRKRSKSRAEARATDATRQPLLDFLTKWFRDGKSITALRSDSHGRSIVCAADRWLRRVPSPLTATTGQRPCSSRAKDVRRVSLRQCEASHERRLHH
jgi:hypothetical protein